MANKTYLILIWEISIQAALLACCLFYTGAGFAQDNHLSQQQSPTVQNEVQETVNKKIEEQQKTIIDEAVIAVKETHNALNALYQNKPQEAIAALENAVGKLELVLTRDPKLAFAPVDVSVVVRDLYANTKVIRNIINEAVLAISAGDIQRARILMSWLASETIIQVTSIPLASYPAAIKAIIPFIDQGKIELAKMHLQAALNTLVITHHVIPMPYLKIAALLKQIEQLSLTMRPNSQNQEINTLLKAIRNQIELAEVLGYGNRQIHKALIKELDNIEKNIKKNEASHDMFDKAQDILVNIMNSATNIINSKYKAPVNTALLNP